MNTILLARPNFFIVKEMKRLMADGGYNPVPINSLAEINEYQKDQLRGIVISTAVSSTVTEDYELVTREVMSQFPGVPIMLATLIAFGSIQKAIELKFEKVGIRPNLLSMSQAATQSRFDPTSDFLVIQKDDISIAERYAQTLSNVQRFFR